MTYIATCIARTRVDANKKNGGMFTNKIRDAIVDVCHKMNKTKKKKEKETESENPQKIGEFFKVDNNFLPFAN